jgi:uncharacterized protein YjbI with pentapeptide repeats
MRDVALAGADLRGADLREAALAGADLTGADVGGADFDGAALGGAKVAGLDAAKSKNFRPPAARAAGPKLLELAALAAASKKFTTRVEVDLGKGEHARLAITATAGGPRPQFNARSGYGRDGHQSIDLIAAPTFEQGMINLADRWPGGTPRLDSVTVQGSSTLRGAKLQELATAAWAEAFGASAPPDPPPGPPRKVRAGRRR